MKYIVPISDDSSSALSVKFRSLVPKDISMWYDDRQEGVYQGILKFGQETTVTSYPGHQFYFQYAKGSKDIINRIEVTDHQVTNSLRFN